MGIQPTLRVIVGAALAGALVAASAPYAAADQVRDDQWALESLEAESAWKITRGKGQTIAVIDGAVNEEHPDLRGNVLPGKNFDVGSPADDNEHGTAMAGLIAGHGHGPGKKDGVMGLAPESKILPIRTNASDRVQLAKAIRYAVDHGATVINISQGGATYSGDVADAVAHALKKDVPVFAATGNTGGPVEYPAKYPGVVAVGGLKKDGTIWEDSNRGKETLVSAPGAGVVTTGGPSNLNGYQIGDGTSDATAYSSAAAALVKAKYPDLSAGQVVNRMTETAELPASAKGVKAPDKRYGYGAIRPLAALQEDVPEGSKYGPLRVPQQLKYEIEEKKQLEEDKALEEKQDREFVILWTITGILAFLFVGGIVLIIVLIRRRRRNRNNGPGGPGVGGGYAYPPGQAPGYGMPQQQQPYAQQPPAPPQQPPPYS
jgi:type VII secretion-associated serine protease mycosin